MEQHVYNSHVVQHYSCDLFDGMCSLSQSGIFAPGYLHSDGYIMPKVSGKMEIENGSVLWRISDQILH